MLPRLSNARSRPVLGEVSTGRKPKGKSGPVRGQKRYHSSKSTLLLATCLAMACSGKPPAPNVVIVSLDTVRADGLPFYGYARNTSPALSALAAGGAVFENAYAQAPNTVPTHASLLTGRYPFQHGMYLHGMSLAADETSLAEIMQGHGYRTFGLASSVRFHRAAGYDQGFEVYETFYDLAKNERAQHLTERALELAGTSDEKPFFAFLHYFDAHGPYAPPEPYRSSWHSGLPVPTPEDTVDYMTKFRWPGQTLTTEVIEYLRALYDGGLRYQDEALGHLFEGLRVHADGRSTLVIVTADHGEEFKEHGFLMHSHFLHEELVRVPLVVYWPGRIAAGRRLATPAQTVDLLPTVLELLGLPRPGDLPGRSLAPGLLGTEAQVGNNAGFPADVVVLEAFPSWGIIATLATGRFKWVEGRGSGLFRLDEDPAADHEVGARYPQERASLASFARELGLPRAVRAHQERAQQQRRSLARKTRRERAEEQELRDRLRALGYVEEARETP